MDIQSLRHVLEQANLASLAAGFAIGFIFTFNPVALAAVPVSLAYVTKGRAPGKATAYGGLFILGMLATHVVLGVAAGLGGNGLQRIMGREWGLVLGPLLIVLGLMWPGWLRLPLPTINLRARRAATVWGALGLGVSFSVAVCPICTPALVVLLGIVAGTGSAWFGAVLLLAFALGRVVPVIVGAIAVDWLLQRPRLRGLQKVFEISGAIMLVLSGLYLLNAYYFVIPIFAQ